MAAIVFNINSAPNQTTDASALSGNTNELISSSANATNGLKAPVKSATNLTSTTGLFLALNVAKQASTLVTSNVGKITGNSHFQNQVNTGLKVVATAVGLATHPIMTSIALAFDGANYAINNYFYEREDRIRSAQAQAIAGTLRGRKY